jgi:hypothetical protein
MNIESVRLEALKLSISCMSDYSTESIISSARQFESYIVESNEKPKPLGRPKGSKNKAK